MSWAKSILLKGGAIAGLIAVFASIGTLGPTFNWNNPNWQKLGVNPKAMHDNLATFPNKHCPDQFKGICTTIANGVINFLGL
jgi:hypothetical protein